jgi:hypothetical protein
MSQVKRGATAPADPHPRAKTPATGLSRLNTVPPSIATIAANGCRWVPRPGAGQADRSGTLAIRLP